MKIVEFLQNIFFIFYKKNIKSLSFITLLLIFLCPSFANSFIQDFLQANQQQEIIVGEILQQTEGEKRYNKIEEYVFQHPENLLAQRWLLKMAFDLGTPNHLRKFYLTELRKSQIRSKGNNSLSESWAIMVWHYSLGQYHYRLYIEEAQNADAYLSLHHLRETLKISSDFLPAWIFSKKILDKLDGEKNKYASQICQYHIFRLWNQTEFNPTFFRIYVEDIPEQSILSQIETSFAQKNKSYSTQQPFAQFLEDNLELANWIPENTLQELQLFLQVCAYYYEQSKKLEESNIEFFLKQGLSHSLSAIERIYFLQAKDSANISKYISMEKNVRKYLASFYYSQKLYALGDEQEFIIAYILR